MAADGLEQSDARTGEAAGTEEPGRGERFDKRIERTERLALSDCGRHGVTNVPKRS